MEIFKNRPLVIGCTMFFILLLVSYFLPSYFSILLIISSIVLYLTFIVIYKLTNNKRILKNLIKFTATTLLLIICGTVALLTFKKDEKIKDEYINQEKEIVATIDKEIYRNPYGSAYIAKISSKNNLKVILITQDEKAEKGDEIKALVTFEELLDGGIGYNEEEYYRPSRIFLKAEVNDEIEILSKENYTLKHYLRKINNYLDNIIFETLNEETAGLVSAMLLGNREGLSDSVERDFARLGINHVLSLSGMHLALIAVMLNSFLGVFRIDKRLKYLIMILAVTFFVLLTGFSESAVRSAIMVIIFYTLFYFGMKGDSVTTLFVAVTIICIFSPYLIFSTSLMLSFFAMLSCLSSSYFIRRMRKIHKIRPKFVRSSAYVMVTSIFAVLFTLPIVFLKFKNISLLSPIANVLIVPFITLLLYFSPFVLVFGKIPYLNLIIKFLCEKLTAGILFVVENIAKIPNITISFSNTIQIIGVLIMTFAIILILVLSNEKVKFAFYTLLVGVLVFSVTTISIFIMRGNEVAISSYEYNNNDIVSIESNNKLMIIENSNGKKNVSTISYFYQAHLGYNEIEKYVFTDYSRYLYDSIDSVTDKTYVKNILLPYPKTTTEENYYSKIENLCKNKGINLTVFYDYVIFEESKIDFMQREDMGNKNAVAFRISANNGVCTYVCSNARMVPNYFIEDSIEISDVVIFGSYGPSYKKKYNYKTKTLDFVVFLGKSKYYCRMHIEENQIKEPLNKFIFK